VNFDWTADQEAFRASVRGFATRLAAREAPDGFDREAWGACARFGIQGLVVPEELGGSGAGALTAAAALEALGEGGPDAGLLFSLNAQMWAVQHPLVRFGSPEQQQRYLPGLCDGSLIGAHASTEPDAGSDVFSLRTRAVADRDHYVLSGSKAFASNAPVADVFLVLATTDPGRGFMGLCAFLVDRDTPGLEVGAPLRKMGLRGSPIADLHLDDCRVPADAMLGRRGGGMAVFTSAMEWERTLILASVLGAMQRQLDQCVAFANERRQFDQPIAGFQAVSHRIVGMKLRLDAGRLLLQRAAWLLDEGRSAASEAALAKWWVAESYLASSLDAVQVHGGAGYLEDTGLSSAVADAVAARIYSGTSEMQMNVVAHHLGLDQ
jgi:alkylation response protein AidB-like acyl-CoA dehydrogenase